MTPDGQTVTFNFSEASFDDGEEDNGSDVEVGEIPQILFYMGKGINFFMKQEVPGLLAFRT